MLRQRLITAAILAPIFIAAIYVLPLSAFGLLFAVVVTLAAWEWAGLTLVASPAAIRWVAPLLQMALLLALWRYADWQLWVVLLALPLWAMAFVQVFRFAAPVAETVAVRHWWQGWPGLTFGLLLLSAAWSALVLIRQLPDGSNLLLALFALVWLADAGAYFAGKAFGKRRLAPRVSPGKTWEGAIGGLLVSASVVLIGFYLKGWLVPLWPWVLVGLIAVSVLGDLFESVLKRSAQQKDSGTLLPGHGGVLDRIDSIIAVLPFLAAGLLYLNLPPAGSL